MFGYAQTHCAHLLFLEDDVVALRPFLGSYRHWMAQPASPSSDGFWSPLHSVQSAPSFLDAPAPPPALPSWSRGRLARQPAWFWVKLHYIDEYRVYSVFDHIFVFLVGTAWTAVCTALAAVLVYSPFRRVSAHPSAQSSALPLWSRFFRSRLGRLVCIAVFAGLLFVALIEAIGFWKVAKWLGVALPGDIHLVCRSFCALSHRSGGLALSPVSLLALLVPVRPRRCINGRLVQRGPPCRGD